MKKTEKIGIAVIMVCFICGGILLSNAIHSGGGITAQEIKAMEENNSKITLCEQMAQSNTLNESEVKNEFARIYKEPYKENVNDCSNKTEEFAKYLYNKGETNIKIVTVDYKTKEYGHEYLIWNDKVYDPTNNIYGMDVAKYQSKLRELGFTGLQCSYMFKIIK
jgi:Zn-dependent alcohol dehydrogenase